MHFCTMMQCHTWSEDKKQVVSISPQLNLEMSEQFLFRNTTIIIVFIQHKAGC